MANKLLIVDGDAMLFRYFGHMSADVVRDGIELGLVQAGLYGVQKTVREHGCSHLMVVFDQGSNTFRHKMYPEYKANRPPRPESMVIQKKILIDSLKDNGVAVCSSPDFEGDDVINSVARHAVKIGYQVLADARDKDMFALLPEIQMWDSIARRSITRESVLVKTHGVDCKRIADWLALVGDKSDNIPGIEKIGDKTAGKFLSAKGGTLEGLLNDLSDIPDVFKERLHQNRQKLIWFRNFILLRDDAPFISPDACVFEKFSVPNAMKNLDISPHCKPEATVEKEFSFTPTVKPFGPSDTIAF